MRNRCQVAYVGDHEALCRMLGRYKMYVDTRDLGLASHLMLEGFWEMWVTQEIISLVRPGMIVADIGANLGYYTMIMADLVGPGGHVHAFEPNPVLARLLDKNIFVNGYGAHVSAHHMALTDEVDCEMELFAQPQDPKTGYVMPLSGAATGTVIHGTRLDSRVDWAQIELVKIDVEGAEELVWAGMQGLLDNGKLKTAIVEFTPDRYEDPAAFLDRLLAPGFSLAKIDYYNGIVELDRHRILNEANQAEDIMLVLRR